MFQQQLQALTTKLSQKGVKVTCAESCTGGLLAANLTRLPGSSDWFDVGFITYSNDAKKQLLDVKQETLRHYGAVSEEVAREMALGALIRCKSHYSLSITGIAGPDGGSEDKPVGLVWFGLASKQRIWAESRRFNGNRDQVRAQAVQFAIEFLASKLDD